ncbi:MAG TPA: tryptophan--tRNA ligase [Candidatus Pacearchaeota archaeon]|jgi:tryptophanyl-tRNA synthetase|nr:tryptophan--tRNA ligase [Candidatus Pacearchaeota archaeon]HOS12397.1 tryptophan--tRNA ligase [Candidatus Pacearchaeota archaeon]HPL72441.1 tryptophan--tRNA ligase [Candidatus Pacearchaeota archaeon]
MKKVFSGIRPTGNIHIGNYLGAISQWIQLQEENDCIFSIVDWHAITTPYNESTLQDTILETASIYLACGIDPKKCILFIQSDVKQHTELTWLLGSITPLGELQRMTQFKDKSKKHKEYINAGLLNYPILMASDILLYDADIVPVGKDQTQHVELTRNIAQKFNKKYGKTFTLPESLISKKGAIIYSLQEIDKKMSKTGDPKGCIGIFDKPEEIKKKIMSAQTDSENEIRFDLTKKKGISNLLNIYSLFSKKTIKEIENDFVNKGYNDFKKSLAELLIDKLKTIQENKIPKEEIKKILNAGAKKAEARAEEKMKVVRKRMGLSL